VTDLKVSRVALVDGYVDEPTILGVPPYISTYPRYIAGAIWTKIPSAEIFYRTIDQVRASFIDAQNLWAKTDLIILIAGMIVPGKYVGGTPISVREAKELFSSPLLDDIPKALVGPWARFGCGIEGGKLALGSDVLSPPFDYIVSGDPEVVIGRALDEGNTLDSIDLSSVRTSSQEIEQYILRGSRIVTQHPEFDEKHIICEIESYRGCPRFLTGGCSFCIEPSYGEPQQRTYSAIAEEIAVLDALGVRAFRIGHQADLFTYGSTEMGEEEFPRPNPEAIEQLFFSIRSVAPNIEVLHIDNVNPGTLARHPKESIAVAKSVIKYHTPGDVAAFGVESVDPEVIRRNNLKADADEILSAVRLLNEVGGGRPPWGLPHLLPGINLLYGLPGESKRTLEYNMNFLQNLLNENLLVRRINIRQVIGLPGTRVVEKRGGRVRRNEFYRHREEVRDTIDIEMIKRVAPQGTILNDAFIESDEGGHYLLRQLGTYPLLCHMPKGRTETGSRSVFVVDHGPRSLTVLPSPFKIQRALLSQWKAIPGIGAKRATRVKGVENIQDLHQLQVQLEMELPEWLSRNIDFEL
jgi:radical SAM superfamily enzyme with C-terminal helix-hairpin-helix motif